MAGAGRGGRPGPGAGAEGPPPGCGKRRPPAGGLLSGARPGAAGGAPVTWTFLGLCLAVTLPGLAFPAYRDLFSGLEPREHPWQLFTAVLQHGWPGFPAPVHLGLNTFLILEAGRPCERLLGSGRFLILCLLSTAATAVTQILFEGVNGSSLVIWSWGPALYVGLAAGRSAGGRGLPVRDPGRRRAGAAAAGGTPPEETVGSQGGGPVYPAPGRGSGAEPGRAPDSGVAGPGSSVAALDAARIKMVLFIMYIGVTLVLPLVPYALGWRGHPLDALVMGNIFHLTATAVGIVMAAIWRRTIRERAAAGVS